MVVHISSGYLDRLNPHDPVTAIWILFGLFGLALVVAPMLARWLNNKP
jgi:hypothetical protein